MVEQARSAVDDDAPIVVGLVIMVAVCWAIAAVLVG